MAPVVEFTPSKRGRIIQLKELGWTYDEIHDELGVSKSGAWKTVQRDKKHNTRKSLPRSGRPAVISRRTRRLILREITKDRFTPWTKIAEHLGTVTARQVEKVAHENGYHRRIARRKPFLTAATVKKRLEWVRKNMGTDWNKVVWTDEVKIELGEMPGHRRVTRRPGEEFLPETIQPTFRSGRQSMMLWSCIAHNKKGPLLRLEMSDVSINKNGKKRGGGLNAAKYVEQVFSGPLPDFVASMESERGPGVMVVEDGAPSHRGGLTTAAREKMGMKRLTHPPSSPDLNPIEPLWLTLKNRIADIPGSGNSLENLWAAAQQAWASISLDEINAHTSKMTDRVSAVEQARGWHTKF